MKNFLLVFLCSFFICILVLLVLLPILTSIRAKQEVLGYIKEHKAKSGTPTFGGIAFVVATSITSLIFYTKNTQLSVLCLVITIAYAVVGFLDDFIKVFYKRNLGLRAYQKILMQLAISVIVAIFANQSSLIASEFEIPFTNKTVFLGKWSIPLVVFIFLATTNGVNLTDGLDGLASTVCLVVFVFFVFLLSTKAHMFDLSGWTVVAEEYTNMAYFALAVCGSLMAYLMFNVFPAKIFMGDTGSMALGGAVACVAVFSKSSFLIPIVGIVFVLSVASVVLQVVKFKLTGRRMFLMAPLHHHLQQKGLSEPRIVSIYATVTVVVCVAVLLFGVL